MTKPYEESTTWQQFVFRKYRLYMTEVSLPEYKIYMEKKGIKLEDHVLVDLEFIWTNLSAYDNSIIGLQNLFLVDVSRGVDKKFMYLCFRDLSKAIKLSLGDYHAFIGLKSLSKQYIPLCLI